MVTGQEERFLEHAYVHMSGIPEWAQWYCKQI